MKYLRFKKNQSQLLYDDYIGRCERYLKVLTQEDQDESLMELNSFIYEYMNHQSGEDETMLLQQIIDRLGEPAVTLHEVVATKKVNQALRTYQLHHLFQALLANLKYGFAYVLLFILSIFLLSFPVLIILKLIFPNDTGLFIGDGTMIFGFVSQHDDKIEVLGYWLFPFAILLFTGLYFTIFYFLKQLKKETK